MKTWSSIPGVTYPKGLHPRRRVRFDEPRISAAEIAALFGCTRAHARRIGAAHGAPVTHAVDPASGKRVCYYRASGIATYHAAKQPAHTTARGHIPAGYCTAAHAATLAGSYRRLLALTRRSQITRIPGHSRAGKFCYYYRVADLQKHTPAT